MMRKHFTIGNIEISYSGYCNELTIRQGGECIKLESKDACIVIDELKDFVNAVEFEKVIREISKEDLGGKFIAMDKDGGYWFDGDVKNYIDISGIRLNCYSGEWFESLRLL